MTRLLLLLLIATGASAQTPLEALYGTWETTRDTTFKAVRNDGTSVEFTTLYSALEISATALTDLTVSSQASDEMPQALEVRYPYRAEDLDLLLTDGIRVRLRPVGARLAMKWMQDGQSYPEVLLDRAAPPVVPESLRGVWIAYVTDAAGVVLDLPVRLDARSMTIGNDDPIPTQYADGLLLATDNVADAETGEIQTYRVFAVRQEGAALVLDDRRESLRLVRR